MPGAPIVSSNIRVSPIVVETPTALSAGVDEIKIGGPRPAATTAVLLEASKNTNHKKVFINMLFFCNLLCLGLYVSIYNICSFYFK